jgi:hypothetical protein
VSIDVGGEAAMLEILALFVLCRNIGRMARAKGWRSFRYQLLLVILWLVGEFVGGLIGGIAIVMYANFVGPLADEAALLPYLVALIGAVICANIAFRIVRGLPDLTVDDSDSAQENFVKPGIATGGTGSGTFQL